MKKKLLIGLGAAAVLLIGYASSTSTSPSTTGSGTPSHSTKAPVSHHSASPKPSKGLGSKDATADVKLYDPVSAADSSDGLWHVPVAVTNHSSKASTYVITLELDSADGKTRIDTADVFVDSLAPGQRTFQQAYFLSTDSHPAGSKIVLKEVQRTAA